MPLGVYEAAFGLLCFNYPAQSMNAASPPEEHGEEPPSYEEPTEEEVAQMRAATPIEAREVDLLILGACTVRWRKVAMVIALAMNEFESRFGHLPLAYLQARMQELEDLQAVQIQGDVWAMRHSEIRLAEQQHAA